LLEEYKDILTKNCDERNIIMQCVEHSRKMMPDFKKTTLAISASDTV